MRNTLSAILLTLTMLIAAPGDALAQQNQVDITALRTRDVLSAQDRQAIGTWVADHLQQLLQAIANKDTKQVTTIRRNLVEAAGQGATPAFRTAYAEVCGNIFRPHLNSDSPVTATYLMQILGQLRQPSAIDAILAGLASKHASVRYWAAKAIRNMHSEIAAIPNLPERVIAALEKAGQNEGYPPTAEVIYQAVDFRRDVPRLASRVIDAMLKILQARLKFFDRKITSDFYPEAYALRTLTQSAGSLSDQQKKLAVQIASTVLQKAVDRWQEVAPDPAEPTQPENPLDPTSARKWKLRYQLALVCDSAENLLSALIAQNQLGAKAPSVADLMRNVATADDVRSELAKWQSILKGSKAAAAPTG